MTSTTSTPTTTTLRGHRHRAQGDNWYFDIEETDDPDYGPITFAPIDYREMSLEQARAYAHAILAALDEVAGVGTSGRAARRLYERLSGQSIDVDAFQTAREALGLDVFEMFTGPLGRTRGLPPDLRHDAPSH